MGNSRIRGVWLGISADHRRVRCIILVAVTDGRCTVRLLVAPTVTVSSTASATAAIRLRSSLVVPLRRLVGWRRGGLIGVRLRGRIGSLLRVLGRGISLRSVVWVVIGRRERHRSVRVGVVRRSRSMSMSMSMSMAVIGSPLRLGSRIAIRLRVRAAVRHSVLGRIWLPSVFIPRLRAVVVAPTAVVVAASTAA
jgi:hypothetical protein